MLSTVIGLMSKAGYAAGVMTGGAVILEGAKRVTARFTPKVHAVIAGPATQLQGLVDYFDFAGFRARAAKEVAGKQAATAPPVSGAASDRRKAAFKLRNAKKAAEKDKNAELAMMRLRWAEFAERVAAKSEAAEADGDNKAAEMLGKVALVLAQNATKPPPGPQSELASDMTDAAKSLITDLVDSVNRTTSEPDYDSLVSRISESSGYGIHLPEEVDYADADEDFLLEGQVAGKAGKAKPGKTAKKGAPAGATRAKVAGCCSSCSAGAGSCTGGEGVPGEMLDGSIFGLQDSIFATPAMSDEEEEEEEEMAFDMDLGFDGDEA